MVPAGMFSGEDITLRVALQMVRVDGRDVETIGFNGTVPAPLLRLRERQNARLHVVNDLDEETSLHWHGLIVPTQMGGVPGVSFPGIKASGQANLAERHRMQNPCGGSPVETRAFSQSIATAAGGAALARSAPLDSR